MRASPGCPSSSSSSSKLAGFSPSARSAAGSTRTDGGSCAARSWARSPAAMDSDDEMVEEAVEGTSFSLGLGEEARRAWNAEGVAGCDPRGAGPGGRHCPLRGWPAARLGHGPGGHGHAAGSARCALGRRPGPPGGYGHSSPPATACVRPPSCEPAPHSGLPPLGGGRWGCAGDSPLRPAVSAERPHAPVLAAPSPSPAASPFLPLAAATCGDRGRVRPPAQRMGPNQARGSRGPGGRSCEKMKSLQGSERRSRPGA